MFLGKDSFCLFLFCLSGRREREWRFIAATVESRAQRPHICRQTEVFERLRESWFEGLLYEIRVVHTPPLAGSSCMSTRFPVRDCTALQRSMPTQHHMDIGCMALCVYLFVDSWEDAHRGRFLFSDSLRGNFLILLSHCTVLFLSPLQTPPEKGPNEDVPMHRRFLGTRFFCLFGNGCLRFPPRC